MKMKKAECLGRSKIEDELELGRLLERERRAGRKMLFEAALVAAGAGIPRGRVRVPLDRRKQQGDDDDRQ